MTRDDWELLSWISSFAASVVTVIGLFIIIIQLYLQGKQARLETLDRLFAELDTREARLARRFIYSASPEQLRMAYLHDTGREEHRNLVEDTLATFERVAYKIVTKQVPSNDAFNLYGGVLLSVANRLWGYIEDQRQEREKNPIAHKLIYRRYFESAVRAWIPKYCSKRGLKQPPKSWTTQAMLEHIFPQPSPAEADTMKQTVKEPIPLPPSVIAPNQSLQRTAAGAAEREAATRQQADVKTKSRRPTRRCR